MTSSEAYGRPLRRVTIANTMAVFGLSLMMAIAWNLTSPRTEVAAAPAPAMTQQELYTSVYNGWKWWHVYCYRCHGTDAVGTPLAPNLTDLNRKVPLKEFLKTVRDGFPDEGMQAWSKLLDDKQITQLYYYVQARTDKVLPPGRPDEVGPNKGPWVPPAGWPKN
jgi:mono/diheme cytochrome c family protein